MPTVMKPNGRALVDFIVIGAMKCGTTSMHHYLDTHPDLGLAPEKEINYFFGEDASSPGSFWRGDGWYGRRFPPGALRRGDVSPGYTSPDHPEVAARIARCAPAARLVYLVRDPLARAVSQYRHHRRDGAEWRPLAEAILDPNSHYVLRSRYADRLAPFLDWFPPEQIAVVDHQDLLHRTRATMESICWFLGVVPRLQPAALRTRLNRAGTTGSPVPDDVAEAYHELVADDVADFEELRATLTIMDPHRQGHVSVGR